MMRSLALIFAVAATVSQAEVVTFRSGDHPDFARLVADITAGGTWRVGRAGEGYALQLSETQTYDISGVFERIQRNRLASVRPGEEDGRLMLDLACLCHIDAFLFSPDMLVIDIKDGPPPPESPFEMPLEGGRPSALAILPILNDDARAETVTGLALLPDPLAIIAETNPRVTATEQGILESLARAASQGLLDFDLPADDAGALPNPQIDVAVAAPLAPFPDTFTTVAPTEPPSAIPFATFTGTPRPGLRVETSVDRDRPSATPPALASDGGDCLDDSHFDIAAWAASDDFATEIGLRRAGLTSERDQFPDGAVTALARSYLYFGFGREALQALALDNIRSPEREIMRILAQVVDGESSDETALSGQEGCTRPVALWAALARKNLTGTTEAERIAIVTAYHVLPGTLRPLLGEKLARLFLDAGDAATAEAIIALGPETGFSTPEVGVTTAAIKLETDGPEAAITTLEDLTADQNQPSPEAVIALINLSIAENRPIGDDILSLASAMRFENRSTALGQQLADAEFRALLATDRFDDAWSFQDSAFKDVPVEQRLSYRTDLAIAMAERMPNAPFLAAAFGRMTTDLGPAAENALARRLLALGFSEEAAGFVSGPASGPDMAERRYLRAEAAFAMGLAEAGEVALSGMTDPRAMALRDTISLGSPAAAPDPDIAWRTGTWVQLERGSDPLLQAASAAMLTTPVIPGPDSTLAERAALVTEAEATRTLAADLLSRFTIPPEDPVPTIN